MSCTRALHRPRALTAHKQQAVITVDGCVEPFYDVSDDRCNREVPPDECVERAGALRETSQRPWVAVIFWYPPTLSYQREILEAYAGYLWNAIAICDQVAHGGRMQYHAYAVCIFLNMQRSIRALVVTSASDTDLVCPAGVIVKGSGTGFGLSARIYLLPGLD